MILFRARTHVAQTTAPTTADMYIPLIWKRVGIAYTCAILAAITLRESGMTNPHVIRQFYTWNHPWPLLLFFITTLGMYAVWHHYILSTFRSPILAERFSWSTSLHTVIDRRLIVGSIVFGIGWALSGLCPGPALVSAFSGHWSGLVVSCSIIAGMIVVVHVSGQDSVAYVARVLPLVGIIITVFVLSRAVNNINNNNSDGGPWAQSKWYRIDDTTPSSALVLYNDTEAVTHPTEIYYYTVPVSRTFVAAIGLATSFGVFALYIGRVFGFSGILRQWITSVDQDTTWVNIAILYGLATGAWVGHVLRPAQEHSMNETDGRDAGQHDDSATIMVLLRNVGGGMLVGVGSTMANGCTSGHGICGVARLSTRSTVAVFLFMASAFTTTFLYSRIVGAA